MMPVSATCRAASAATCGSCSRASAAVSRVTASPLASPRSWRAARAAQLGLLGRDDELAGDPVRHPLGAGEVEQRMPPLRGTSAPCGCRAGSTGPEWTTPLLRPVWWRAQSCSFSSDGHLRRRVLAQHALGDGQPEDAAADDGDAAGAGHGIRRVAPAQPRRGAAAMIRAYSRPESFTVRTWVS